MSCQGKSGDDGALSGVADAVLRAGFVRKVYGILSAQMALTVAVATTCTMNSTIRLALISTGLEGWLKLVVFVPTIVCLFSLHFAKRSYPLNYVLLFFFTACISINVGFVCAVVFEAGLGLLILQAASITTAIFLGLSAYSLCSKRDFSFLGGFLSAALFGLIFANLIGWLLGVTFAETAIACCGALTFCGYIVYDTYRLSKKLDYDDYIVGAIELYLDIVNLFLYILQILIKLQEAQKGKKGKKR